MKNARYLFLLLPFMVFFNSCRQSVPEVVEAPLSNYRLMTPAYYRDAPDGTSIQVRFYESQRIYDLPKSTFQFDQMRSVIDVAIKAHGPVRITADDTQMPFLSITGLQAASAEETQSAIQMKSVVPEPGTVEYIIPSMEKLNEIFAFCKAQGCATGTSTIDYCIPFQYVVDGCYARAHKMRQIMENNYGYSCEKVFSYEGPTGYLAVDAGDCCVYWWYHVAPLVTVRMPHGKLVKYVVDPSMFDGPVSIDTWTSAQENFDCTPNADFGYTDITPGYIYAPGGWTDNYYASTNWTLQAYADLVTCP